MLFANFVNVFLRKPPLVLTHNYGNVLRVLDFPAPAFQLLVGVSLPLFLDKRRRFGRPPLGAKLDALRRFFLLVCLGLLLDAVGAFHLGLRWGVLQTLGLGGAVGVALADVSNEAIVALSIALLGLFSGACNGEVHGSPQYALAFVPLTLAGLVLGRLLVAPGARERLGGFVRAAATVAAGSGTFAALLYASGVPFNKTLGTSSFVTLATAATAAGLAGLALFEARGGRFPAWLLAVGSNALTAWVLQYLLVYYPAWLAFPAWRRLPLAPGMAAIVGTMLAIGALTIALGRRGIRVPI